MINIDLSSYLKNIRLFSNKINYSADAQHAPFLQEQLPDQQYNHKPDTSNECESELDPELLESIPYIPPDVDRDEDDAQEIVPVVTADAKNVTDRGGTADERVPSIETASISFQHCWNTFYTTYKRIPKIPKEFIDHMNKLGVPLPSICNEDWSFILGLTKKKHF